MYVYAATLVTKSHVAACSVSAERRHLFHERCLVILFVAEEAAAATRPTYTHTTHTHTHTHTYTPSLPGRENAQRARVEEAVGHTESRTTWSAVARAAQRERERERERGGA